MKFAVPTDLVDVDARSSDVEYAQPLRCTYRVEPHPATL